MPGDTSGNHYPLLLLGSAAICGLLCRIPVEPGAREHITMVLSDFGERKTEGKTGRQAGAWAGLAVKASLGQGESPFECQHRGGL